MTIPEQARDIVERLRNRREMINYGHGNVADVPDDDCVEAADEIERLRLLVGVERSALPPLRAREEIARAIEDRISKIPANNPAYIQFGKSTLANVLDGSLLQRIATDAADAILSSTAGQEWRDGDRAAVKQALAPFTSDDLCRAASSNIEGDASPIFQRDNTILTLGDFRRARAVFDQLFPAPPVAGPIVAEKRGE